MQGASRKSQSPSREVLVLLWETTVTHMNVQKAWSRGPSMLANCCPELPQHLSA